MGLYDAFYAGLTCPNCGCQASVEAQTKDFQNAIGSGLLSRNPSIAR
jgi:hypothetical protein